MRRIKTMPLFLAALVAALLAVPAAASAVQWTEGGQPLQGSAEIELTGSLEWTAFSQVGYYCEYAATATISPGDDGQITDVDFTFCEGRGNYSGMPATGTALSLPWDIHAQSDGKIHLDEFVLEVDWQYAGSMTTQSDQLTILPNDASEMSSGWLSGTAWAGGAGAWMSGEMTISPEGTYGFE